jgi:protein-S-isoprenylcysteine O-methyltransferase Ste14
MVHVPPPVFALAAVVAQQVLSRDRPRSAVRSVAATALAAGSVALIGGAAREFRRRETTFDPIDPSQASRLVTRGPNRLTRNPMYLGMAGLVAANGVRRGGLLPLLPVAGFVAAVDRLQITREEAALRQRFGEDYEAYVETVPRWIGPLHR